MAIDPEGTASLSGVTPAPGSLLGHYRMQQPLGAGGMGRVYEAIDQKLHRTVAIKVLPPGAVDEETRHRFLREAQAASALNHPNIITVYEVGCEGGMDYIVMERVAGQTLRQVIGKRGLEPRIAIQYAMQIAAALAAAHDAGIVHRDLKPGNIMVTDRDLVKVLDFGLAKQAANLGAGITAEASLTGAGRVVGTVSYMSPEQAQGKSVDGRSDIFSFGSVFYEMLTGRKAFEEESGIDTLAAILHREPPLLQERLPALSTGIQRVVQKCLAKKPHDRLQNMSDVRLILEDQLADLDLPATPAAAGRKRIGWTAILAAGVAGALIAGGALRFLGAPPAETEPEPAYRMLTADKGLNDYPAISKDGKFVAFASDRSGRENLDIWLQQIGGREPIRLTNDPADETDPAFSPDSTKIAFRSEKNGGGIYVLPTLGGDPVLLAPAGRNPRFSPDGRWVAYWTGRGEGSNVASQVFVIDAGGGQPRQVHPEMAIAKYPSWMPRGDKLLVLGWKDPSPSSEDWWVLPVENGSPHKTGAIPRLKGAGLFRPQPGLRVEPAPLGWLETGGGQALFAGRLGESANLWEIGLSESGSLGGPARRLTSGPGRQGYASWAMTNDGERLAFSDELVTFNVWTMPVEPARGQSRGEMTRVTDSVSTEWAPSITADGRQVLYIGHHSGTWALMLRDLEGGRERELYSSPSLLANARITGDGRTVFFSNATYDLVSLPTTGGTMESLCGHCGTVTDASFDGRSITYEPIDNEDLTMFDVAERKKFVLGPRPGPETILTGGRISRDGKWVAFHSIHSQTRTTQVWIAPVDRSRPRPAAEWIAITDGKTFAQDPSWGPDDRLLYFVSERDGFRCYWGQPLDAATKRPAGEPFALQHFHSARRSLRGTASTGYLTGVSTGGGRAVFSFAELTANIWLKEKARPK